MQVLIANAKKAAITTGATWRLSDVLVADVWFDILRVINGGLMRRPYAQCDLQDDKVADPRRLNAAYLVNCA
jgi:hypothetical protein